MAAADTARLIASLELDDKKFGPGIAKAIKGVDKLEGRFSKIGGMAQKGIGNAVANIQKIGLAAGGIAVGGLVAAVKVAGDFEAQLNTINTVAGVSQDQLAGIGEQIRALARDTGTSTDELTTAYYDLVSAGVQAADAQGVLTAANTLAIGGLATTGETVDLLTTALNSYGIEATKAGDVADYFAQAIAAGKVTAADLASSFAQVAPIAASTGIEIQELAAGYAQLTAAGVPAAEASTQMRSAIVALQKPSAELEKLQKKLNVNFLEIAEEQGLAAAYAMIREEADKAGIPLIEFTGRIEGASYALAVTGENAASYAENLRLVEGATEGAGVAAQQAQQRQQGFTYQLGRLKAIAKDVGITIGQALLPTLTDLATELGEFLVKPETQRQIKQLATDLGAGLREVAVAAKKIPWESIGDAMKLAGQGAKAAYDLFMGMPDWVKTAVITGWGLNKLTGGALGGIVGELSKGLIKGVLGIQAGHVTVNAATMTGGGGGPGGVGPGGAGTGPGKVATAAALGAAVLGPIAVLINEQDMENSVRAGVADVEMTLEQFLASNPTAAQVEARLAAVEAVPDKLDGIQRAIFDLNLGPAGGSPRQVWEETMAALQQRLVDLEAEPTALDAPTVAALSPAQLNDRMNELAGVTAQVPTAVTGLGTALGGVISGGLGVLAPNIAAQIAQQNVMGPLAAAVERVREETGLRGQALANRLDMTLPELRSIRDWSRETANKDFSPTTNVTVNTTLNVSARAVAAQVDKYRVVRGRTEYD